MTKLTFGTIIQARMGSQRFPGKTLEEIAGKPILAYLLDSLKQCGEASPPVVATSDRVSDDAIVHFCRTYGVDCERGPEENVVERFLRIVKRRGLDAFVRLSGDSPLLDYRLIRRGICLFRDDVCDLVTNVHPRTYPKGQSVEIVRSDTFLHCFERMETVDELEHVTRFFYDRPEEFSITNFSSPKFFGDHSLAIDEPEDLDDLRSLIVSMDKPHWEYDFIELLELLGQCKGCNDDLANQR